MNCRFTGFYGLNKIWQRLVSLRARRHNSSAINVNKLSRDLALS